MTRAAIALLAGLSVTACVQVQDPAPAPRGTAALPDGPVRVVGPGPLPRALQERIDAAAPVEVGLALIDLESGAQVAINSGLEMHAASTMKVPVLYELLRQVDAGRLSLADSVVLKTEFTSIADGSTYALTVTERSESDLHDRVGKPITLRELAVPMIVRSSNLATNMLMEVVGAENVQASMERLGAGGMKVLRGVEDTPAFRAGMNNTTTAAALARVLEAIATCEGLSEASCREAIAIMEGQRYRSMIPAGLPEGTRVASKTGSITRIRHDAAIVYPPGRDPYVLVILTRGNERSADSDRLGAELSRTVWQHLVGDGAGRAAGSAGALAASPTPAVRSAVGADPEELARLHERYRVGAIDTRRFTHAELWDAMLPLATREAGFRVEELGRSAEGRPIRLVSWGSGPTTVLMWSQMHGDESTASMSLLDMIHFLRSEPDHALARLIGERVTLHMIPMLNPDGAERFQRRNALGIDINRDARHQATPEGRILKGAQERLQPEFGFNLHDQNPRTRVGPSDRGAAIALLAPPFDHEGTVNDSRGAAMRLAAYMRRAMEPLVPGYIARYDDSFNPRAFGDLMQQWGVSTVLVESGGWEGDPEKQHLRRTNFVGLLSALEAIATEAWAETDPAWYVALPQNGRGVGDLLLVGGTIVPPGLPAYRADVGINFSEAGVPGGGRITDIGDLAGITETMDTLDLAGLYLHPAEETLRSDDVGRIMSSGRPATFTVRRGVEPDSPLVWIIEEGVVRRPDE